jgi:hypothetical protein
MDKIETYVESKFIVNLCENVPDLLNDQFNLWKKLYDTIAKKSILIIDSKDSLRKKKNNPLINYLMKSSKDGGSEIIEYKEHFDRIYNDEKVILETVNASSVFYLTKSNITNQCGFFISNFKECCQKFSLINKEIDPISVSKGKDNQFESWNDYFHNTPPLNSIIIADNYLLDKTESYDKNLFAIIDALVPTYRIDETIDISIIVQIDLLNPEKKFRIIEEHLNNKNNTFNLNIYLTALDKPHDRIIVSNYFYVTSGHSLDFLNSKGNISKETTLNYVTIGSIKSIKSFYEEISRLSEFTRLSESTSQIKVIGNNSNRILDYQRIS